MNEVKRVWLVSHYAMPPHLEVRTKTIEYARRLQKMGIEVLLVTASTIHNTDINLITERKLYVQKKYEDLNYVHIKCDNYKGSGIKRILNLKQFENRFGKVMKNFALPDAVVFDCNCVNYRGVQKFCKKNNIAFIAEIRDLWPLSIVEYLGFSNNNPIIKYLYNNERCMYEKSNGIIFSFEGGKKYICDKGWSRTVNLDKVFYINNGIDFNKFKNQERNIIIEDKDLASDKFKVLYCGSIRKVNNLDLILPVAKKIEEEKYPIEFIIYGDGDQRKRLESECRDRGIKNIKFKGIVEKKYIPYICSCADINMISVSSSDLLCYGVSWNKLFEYLAIGKPILSFVSPNFDLIKKFDCGISLRQQSTKDIFDALIKLYNLSDDERTELKKRAINGSKQFDFNELTKQLYNVIVYSIKNKV